MTIGMRIAYYTKCDTCGETWGPYADIGEAEYQPALDGWLITDREVLCDVCRDIKEDEDG